MTDEFTFPDSKKFDTWFTPPTMKTVLRKKKKRSQSGSLPSRKIKRLPNAFDSVVPPVKDGVIYCMPSSGIYRLATFYRFDLLMRHLYELLCMSSKTRDASKFAVVFDLDDTLFLNLEAADDSSTANSLYTFSPEPWVQFCHWTKAEGFALMGITARSPVWEYTTKNQLKDGGFPEFDELSHWEQRGTANPQDAMNLSASWKREERGRLETKTGRDVILNIGNMWWDLVDPTRSESKQVWNSCQQLGNAAAYVMQIGKGDHWSVKVPQVYNRHFYMSDTPGRLIYSKMEAPIDVTTSSDEEDEDNDFPAAVSVVVVDSVKDKQSEVSSMTVTETVTTPQVQPQALAPLVTELPATLLI